MGVHMEQTGNNAKAIRSTRFRNISLVLCPWYIGGHVFDNRWKFNGSYLKPTRDFSPNAKVGV